MRNITLIQLNKLITNSQLITENKLISLFSKDQFFKITKDTRIISKFCIPNVLIDSNIIILFPLQGVFLYDFIKDPITFGSIMAFRSANIVYVRQSYPPFPFVIYNYPSALQHLRSIYSESL